MRLGAHWPTDVFAGAVVGVAWLGVSIVALRRAEALGGR
jgi:membrane-associated phospholipid phosphatase